MTVPALIIPILSRYERLRGVVESVGSVPARIVIIDNGGGYWDAMMPAAYDERASVISPGRNLGYAASINLGLKATIDAPWWLFGQADLTWGPDDIERLSLLMETATVPTVGLLAGFGGSGINRAALDAVGFLDENYHPCYCEDCDWMWRARLAGVDIIDLGFSGTHETSLTIREQRYHDGNGQTYPRNVEYHRAKWGGDPWCEVFRHPFDDPAADLSDWTLDPARLREQTW